MFHMISNIKFEKKSDSHKLTEAPSLTFSVVCSKFEDFL